MSRAAIILCIAAGVLLGFAAGAGEAAPAPEAAPAAAEAPAPKPLADLKQVQIQVWISQTEVIGQRIIGNNLNYTRFTRPTIGDRYTTSGTEHSGSVEQVRTNLLQITNDAAPATADFSLNAASPGPFTTTLPAPDAEGGYVFGPRGHPDRTRNTPDAITRWTNSTGAADPSPVYRGMGTTSEILAADRGMIEGIFRAMDTNSDSDLISKPEILVTNGGKAIITAGDEIPYQSVLYKNGAATLTIQWEKTGVDMDLVPTITSADDLVQLNITKLAIRELIRLETITQINNLQIPVFSERSQSGIVSVPDGETLVIGGLKTVQEQRVERRVPILGKIPLAGILFRKRDVDNTSSELLIFVSPTIVNLREMDDDMNDAMNFWRTDSWDNEERIDREILKMTDDIGGL